MPSRNRILVKSRHNSSNNAYRPKISGHFELRDILSVKREDSEIHTLTMNLRVAKKLAFTVGLLDLR